MSGTSFRLIAVIGKLTTGVGIGLVFNPPYIQTPIRLTAAALGEQVQCLTVSDTSSAPKRMKPTFTSELSRGAVVRCPKATRVSLCGNRSAL